MSYLSKVLQPGETIVYTTGLHWRIYLPAAGFLLAAGIVAVASSSAGEGGAPVLHWVAALCALAGIVSALAAAIRRASTELAVTDRRVVYKRGILGRHTIEMNLSKVESVDVDQSIMGRILGYGTIEVRGTGGSLEPFPNISDPLGFRSYITTR